MSESDMLLRYQNEVKSIVIDEQTADSLPNPNPQAILLGVQPGAGKSTITLNLRQQFKKDGYGLVCIDPDEIRNYLHEFETYCSDASKALEASNLTQKTVESLLEIAVEEVTQQKYNVMIEGTYKTPNNLMKRYQQLKDKGYEVKIYFMAVNDEESLIGTIERYVNQRDKKLTLSRFVPPDFHYIACRGLLDSADRLHNEGLANQLSICTRQGNIFSFDSTNYSLPSLQIFDCRSQSINKDYQIQFWSKINSVKKSYFSQSSVKNFIAIKHLQSICNLNQIERQKLNLSI